MYLVIERLAEEFALCEDDTGRFLQLGRSQLPLDAKDGSVLVLQQGKYVCDLELEERLRKANFKLQERVFSDES